jgi:putative membrane protein
VAFVNEAAQSGLGNIMLGELALQKSKNQAVQQFAQAEIKEQQDVKANLTRIAPQIGVTLPTAPSAKFQAAMARLSQLSGTQFDNAYLDEGGVNAHLEVAALFQREAAFGRNPDLINVVNNGLPIINQHFTTASGLTKYQFARVARRYNEVQNTSAR